MELLLLLLLRGFTRGLNILPYKLRTALVAGLLRVFLAAAPRYRRIALKNLALAFPEEGARRHGEILRQHCHALAQMVVDFLRLPSLDAEWAREHIEFPERQRLLEACARRPGRGVLLAAGHLGSFELMPFYMAVCETPIGVVVRSFKQPKLDRWWNHIREAHGTRTIQRKGALKGILRSLGEGRHVGLLFDQNLVRSSAVFVDWFGRPAATTKALGLAAIRTKTPVLVCRIKSTGFDRYRIDVREVECADLFADDSADLDLRIRTLTQRAAALFEEYIKDDPAGWFWLHRRWKTTPEGMPEDFYR